LMDQAVDMRKTLLDADGCSFRGKITADYGEMIYLFSMNCVVDSSGNMTFTVLEPESICGITGQISQEGAALTFDDKVLAFPPIAGDQLTPVSAPWIFINTLRSGYLTGYSREESDYLLYLDDSYNEHPLHLEIRTDSHMTPTYAEIIWQDQRVLSLLIQDFEIL